MTVINKLSQLEREAADFGFVWETPQQIREQITSEIAEIEVHLQDNDKEKLQEEIGDLLHAVFSLTIFCGFDPEETLARSVNKFEKRFYKVKEIMRKRGLATMRGMTFDELMAIWAEAKQAK